jgi:hypothetical protein
MGGSVSDFDLSDVPDGTVATAARDGVATGALKFLGRKLAVNVVTKVLLAIPERVSPQDAMKMLRWLAGLEPAD